MPLPVLLGLPWLAGVIGSGFMGVFAWFMTYLTKRIAFVAAAIVVLIALTSGLFLALEALTSGLVYVLPSSLTGSVGLFAPSNLSVCVSIVVSAHMLRYAYDWNVRILHMKLV